jgi:hypothetical protein
VMLLSMAPANRQNLEFTTARSSPEIGSCTAMQKTHGGKGGTSRHKPTEARRNPAPRPAPRTLTPALSPRSLPKLLDTSEFNTVLPLRKRKDDRKMTGGARLGGRMNRPPAGIRR